MKSFFLSLLLAATIASASPVPASNTGIGSFLTNPELTKSRLDVANGLKGMKTALASLANATAGDANAASLLANIKGGVDSASTGVNAIAQNIIAGVDPNQGDNPQGQVVAGLQTAQTNVDQLTTAIASNTAAATPLKDLTSNLATAVSGGEGVLGAQGKSLADVAGGGGANATAAASAKDTPAAGSEASGIEKLIGGALSKILRS